MNDKNTLVSAKHLLSNVAIIINKYTEIARITGENFNIFKTLGLSTNEVRTHSAFLGELLNPNGSHDLGDIFLIAFLETLKDSQKIDDFNGFKTDNCKIFIEQFIGNISENYEEGGQIDIILVDANNHAIIIENKINADDQKNQLLRYHNYGISNHRDKFKLLYLSLDEDPHKPSLKSLGHLNENDFIKISYSNEIINWLEICKEKAVNHSTLRETITQYLNLIKYLTNNTINNKMKNEIFESMMLNEDTLKASFEISKNLNEVKIAVQLLFWDSLFTKLEGENKNKNIEYIRYYDRGKIKNFVKTNGGKKHLNYGIKAILSPNIKGDLTFIIRMGWCVGLGFAFESSLDADFKKFLIQSLKKVGFKEHDLIKKDSLNIFISKSLSIPELDFYHFETNNSFNLKDEDIREEILSKLVKEISSILDYVIDLLPDHN